MLRRMRWARLARPVALLLSMLLPWFCGPQQAGQAAARDGRERARQHAGHARLLPAGEQRAARGRATWPGPPRSWQYSVPALGGYGQVNCFSGNMHVAVPVVGWGGKGIPTSFVLSFDSAATQQSFMPTWRPPIASGWTHSYNVYLNGAGTSTVTVVEGDGAQNAFTQNVDGSFTAPAGVFDTLVRNVDSTYKLTRKSGVVLNFGSNNKLASIVDLNGNTTSVAYGTNGQVSTITDAASRVLTLGYNTSNCLTTITDPISRQFSISYDTNRHVSQVTFPAPTTGAAQPTFQFASDSSRGCITSFTNRRGSAWSVSWGSSGGDMQWFNHATDPLTHTLTLNNNASVTLENGAQYSWTKDANDNLATLTLGYDPYHPSQPRPLE